LATVVVACCYSKCICISS